MLKTILKTQTLSNKTLFRSFATLDWKNLGFGYTDTKSIILSNYKDSKWTGPKSQDSPYINIHVMSNVIHYGQTLFEGLKAYHTKDGNISLFNPLENCNRLNKGAARLKMPPVPEDLFIDTLKQLVEENKDYVPPYGSGGALYLRPFYFGHGAQMGVTVAPEYMFGAISAPVGLYYPSGLKPVDSIVVESYDRAAPQGVGSTKTAGNYAADLLPSAQSAAEGFPISLYLDAKERKYIEEFSTSNFVAISKDGSTFVTPDSESILQSITNKMLQELAKKKGLKVEKRPVSFDEVVNGGFSETAACGTAVIVTPVKSITKGGIKYEINEKLNILEDLYEEIRGLQTGEVEDVLGWRVPVCKAVNSL
eukprot:snap_masked-scaffold_52-processed-gene-0.19-mRNA-1 protein AED:0.03 eAED:0.03 QI:0/-1/0/1/-1/1/1/0/363